MTFAAQNLQKSAFRVIAVQALVTMIVAVSVLVCYGTQPALAATYGGGLAIIVAVFTAKWVYSAGEMAKEQPAVAAAAFYVVAGKRLLLSLLGFGIGFGVFKLLPVPLLLAFGLSYLGYVFASRRGRY